MPSPLFPLALLSLCLLLLIVERWRLRRAVRSFVHRIHVNGTRGKSSVTAYIAAGLRANGTRTFAKITGIVPSVIDATGRSRPIHRRGRARVQEQFRIARHGAADRCQALVLECMSLEPELQRTESRFLRPHVVVITNIRADHQEVMGWSVDEIAHVYASTIPRGATVILGDRAGSDAISNAVTRLAGTMLVAEPLSTIALQSLPPSVVPENVATALTALKACGVSAEVALAGMRAAWSAPTDVPGELDAVIGIHRFVNGFAANDVPSAERLIDRGRRAGSIQDRFSIILNTRADRPVRTRQFVDWIACEPQIDRIVVAGTHVPFAVRRLASLGVDRDRVVRWESGESASAAVHLNSIPGGRRTFVGLGNIAGDGFRILEHLEAGPERTQEDGP